jgi:sugar lactone lactonase YvrE
VIATRWHRRSNLPKAAASALLVTLAAGLAVAGASDVAHAADPVPGRTIGGPLHAEMYPSGLEVAPDGTIVIADTGNNRVARYNANGTLVWSVGTHGAGTNQFENPRDIGIDASNNVYVADTRNSRIVKLAPNGAWLSSTTGPSTGFSFQLGVTVKGDRIYVGDTGRDRIVVLDLSLNVVRTITGNGACSIVGNRDATADAAGNVYVAGYKTNQIVKFGPTGTCLATWGSTGSGQGQFRTPYGVATHVDPVTGQELLYVADGINNRVQVFTLTGGFVTQFGDFGEPDQPGSFTTIRRVAVDAAGNVWGADLWGARIERWDRTASGFTYNRRIGAVMPEPTSTRVFHEARGMAFSPNGDLWVTDTVHHGFARFDRAGNLLSVCGQRAAEGTRLGLFNWPRGLAVDPATGNLWIADTKQNQLQVLTAGCQGIGFVKNEPAGTDNRSFNWPYDIAIRPSDRWAFVVDTQNHRIKAYDVAHATWPADNKGPMPGFVYGSRGGGNANFQSPSAVAVGPTGDVYVADSGNNRIQQLRFTATGGFSYVRTWNAGGSLAEPEGVAVDSSGRVIVADSGDDQMVVLAPDGSVESTVNGLHQPTAVEVGPDGTIYLADTYADVVRTYTMGSGPPPTDAAAPTGTVTSPANGAAVSSPVTITGTAADDRAVASVRLGIKQTSTGRWWNGTAWQTQATKVSATLASPSVPTTTWSYTLSGAAAGGYGFSTDITDTAGKLAAGTGKPTWRTFTVR